MCRSRRPLSNEYLLAKFGFDTAVNEPCEVCPLSAYRSPRYLNNPEYSKFDDHGVPTHDAAGAELNKTLYKKLKKDMEIAQKKLSKKK